MSEPTFVCRMCGFAYPEESRAKSIGDDSWCTQCMPHAARVPLVDPRHEKWAALYKQILIQVISEAGAYVGGYGAPGLVGTPFELTREEVLQLPEYLERWKEDIEESASIIKEEIDKIVYISAEDALGEWLT